VMVPNLEIQIRSMAAGSCFKLLTNCHRYIDILPR
jgi:hypothetical protein